MIKRMLTKRGNHFTTYVSWTTVLYTLNLYSAVYQLYLNKIGRKKRRPASQNEFYIQLTMFTSTTT